MSRRQHEAAEQATDESRRRDATTRHWHSVHELLGAREDLVGVVPMADLIHENVSWAA